MGYNRVGGTKREKEETKGWRKNPSLNRGYRVLTRFLPQIEQSCRRRRCNIFSSALFSHAFAALCTCASRMSFRPLGTGNDNTYRGRNSYSWCFGGCCARLHISEPSSALCVSLYPRTARVRSFCRCRLSGISLNRARANERSIKIHPKSRGKPAIHPLFQVFFYRAAIG